MARQAAAAEGSRFSHRRDSSQRGMPQECIQQIAGHGSVGGSDRRDRRAAGRQQPGWPWTKPSRRALPTSSSRPTPAGAATGSLYGFQNSSDENLKTNLRPGLRPAHEGGVLAGLHLRLSLRAYVSRTSIAVLIRSLYGVISQTPS